MATVVRAAQTNVFAPRTQSSSAYSSTSSRTDQVPTTSVGDMLGRSQRSSTLPSDSPEYANLCKIVLERRLRNLFVLAVAASSVLLFAATFDPLKLPGSLFNVLPALVHSPVMFIGTVPIILLLKSTLTTTPSTLSTRFSRARALLDASNRKVALAYFASAAILSLAYQSCAKYSSQDPVLGPFYYNKARGQVMLNERFVFLTGLHAFVALFGLAQHVFAAKSRISFDKDIARPIPQRLATAAPAGVRRVVNSSMLSCIFFSSFYVIAKRPVLRLLATGSLTSWTRPHLYDMVRYNGWLSVSLLARSFASAFLLFATWEAAQVLFQTYATQSMLVSQFAPRPNQVLISGLRSSDEYFKHFAFCELATLSLTSEQRRKAIFTEIKADVTRGAWTDISRECLKVVGQELQRARARGQSGGSSASPASSARPNSTTSSSDQTQNGAAVKKEDVFRPVKKTFWDKLASSSSSTSDGSSSGPSAPSTALSAAKGASTAVSSTVSTVTSRVPAILQAGRADDKSTSSSEQRAAALVDGAKRPVTAATRAVQDVEDVLSKRVPAAVREAAFSKDVHLIVEKCVARRQLATWALDALANLLCASLKEDPYGVAQRDIPKILEGMILFLDALEKLEKGLVADFDQGGEERKKVGTAEVEELVLPLQSAARDAVRQVVADFEPYLSEFRFPSHVATRIQLLIDWG
ncbi:hypothetical protein ACM66B_005036 [Microbotryomycetes sp. NB124-2]